MLTAVLVLFAVFHIVLSGMISVGLAADHLWLPLGYELTKAVLAAGVALFLWRLGRQTSSATTPWKASSLLLAGIAVLSISLLADSTLLNLDRTWHRSDSAGLQPVAGR